MSTVQISASEVNKLRQETGAGLMDCKKALVESGGDLEAAIDYLRKKGQKVAAKRADREANEGVVIALTNSDNNKGIVVHLSSETDFVAKNEDFINVAKNIANLAIENFPANLDELHALEMNGATIKDVVDEQVAKIGEKIEVKTYETMEAPGVVAYIHAGNKIGVLLGLTKDSDAAREVGKDVAMQVAAMKPVALDKDGISEDIIKREMEIGMDQARAAGKPEEMLEKIATGKLNKFYKENTLVNQQFVKDGSKTVTQVLQEVDKELSVTAFKDVRLG